MGIDLPPLSSTDPRWIAAVEHAAGECISCHPTKHPLYPESERKGRERRHEAHVGVDFGDVGPGWLVTLDGQPCTDFTTEADALHGWVIAHVPHVDAPPRNGRPPLLYHGDHVITAVLRGAVSIRRAPAGGRIITPTPRARRRR